MAEEDPPMEKTDVEEDDEEEAPRFFEPRFFSNKSASEAVHHVHALLLFTLCGIFGG